MIFEKQLNTVQNERYKPLYDLIRKFEGLYLTAYICPAGVATIGYGSTGRDIKMGMKVTKEWAEQRMRDDVQFFLNGTRRLCPNANDNQLCALTSFSYNVGLRALKNSTLRRKFNAGDIDGARKEILRWNKANGRVLRGLTRRRTYEAALL